MLDTSYYWHFEKALKDWMEEVKPRIWTLTGHRATKQFSVDLGLYQRSNDLHLLKVFRWNRCNFITSKYWALCNRGGTEPEFSKLNRARAFTSRARAELRAHISNIFRARAELRAQIFRAEPSLTIIEPSPSRAFEPQKWKFFQYFEKYLRSWRWICGWG